MPPKGPPPAVKPKPKGLAPPVGKKPNIDIGSLNTSSPKTTTTTTTTTTTPNTIAAIESKANNDNDDEYIASLRGNLRKTNNDHGVNSSVKKVDQRVVDSVVSEPISLSLDPDALDSESENEQSHIHERFPEPRPRMSAPIPSEYKPPATPSKPSTSSKPSFNTKNIASPFKPGVSVSGSFPPPPKRNTTVSPLKKKSTENMLESSPPPMLPSRLENSSSKETVDYAEGMRSPLKKNVSSLFPPPPKRDSSASIKPIRNTSVEVIDNDKDDQEKPPSLPARRSTVKQPVKDNYYENELRSPPKLPARRRADSRASVKSEYDNDRESISKPHYHHNRHKNNGDDFDDDSDAYDRLRHSGNGKHHGGRRARYHSSDEEDVDDARYSRGNSGRSRTSQFTASAKNFSMESLNTAMEKSTPLAKQAMGGLNKMKNKIKSSLKDDDDSNSYSDADDDPSKYTRRKPSRGERQRSYDEYSDDDRYERKSNMRQGSVESDDYGKPPIPSRGARSGSLSRTPEPRRIPSRPERPERSSKPAPPPKRIQYSDEEVEEESDENDENDVNPNVDESIDEDRPSLPARKPAKTRAPAIGVPLPGLTKDEHTPLHKTKPTPPVPAKTKPVPSPPPKKSIVLPIQPKPELAPPPPARRMVSNSSAASAASTPPPAPPSRGKVPAPPPPRTGASAATNSWKQPTLNFEFTSLWFLNDDTTKLPKDLQNLNFQCSHGFVGIKEFKIYAFRLPDLATLKIKLVWKKDSPIILDTLSDEVEFIEPPVATKALLSSGTEKYGEHIANWCEVKEGQTVGDGECWSLAHDALEKACGKHAFVSSGLVHGALIATFKGNETSLPDIEIPSVSDDIRRGDILQFKSCVFKTHKRTTMCGSPDHTAIVLDVQPSDAADRDDRLKWMEIIHQNMGGIRKVRVSDIDLSNLTEGELRVYRPVDADWIVDLAEVVI